METSLGMIPDSQVIGPKETDSLMMSYDCLLNVRYDNSLKQVAVG
jgi:hypothetical protein